jgi:GntR family transcriptional regulator
MAANQAVIRIDLASEIPAYRQIVDAVRAALVGGLAVPGDQLPPIRQLATDLGVHFNTVAEAYRILADEGWLDLKRRRGAVVLHREAPRNADPEAVKNFARRIGEMVAELRASGIPAAAIAKELKTVAEGLQR